MKSYLINLDRSPDRLAHFLLQAGNADLEVTRLRGVDGAALSDVERARLLSPRFDFQPLNAGELGVFLSHRAAWHALVETGEPRAAVFEDDAVLSPDLGALLREIDARPPAGDIIKLETTLRSVVLDRKRVALGGRFEGQRLKSWHGGAAGYVITLACAQRLLQMTSPVADAIDQVLFAPQSQISRTLVLVQVSPAPCVQFDILNRDSTGDGLGSTINRRQTRGRLFRHGPLTDARRAVLRITEALARELNGRRPRNELRVVPFAGNGDRTGPERGE